MLVGDLDRRTSPFCEFFYMPQAALECQGKKYPKVLKCNVQGFVLIDYAWLVTSMVVISNVNISILPMDANIEQLIKSNY